MQYMLMSKTYNFSGKKINLLTALIIVNYLILYMICILIVYSRIHVMSITFCVQHITSFGTSPTRLVMVKERKMLTIFFYKKSSLPFFIIQPVSIWVRPINVSLLNTGLRWFFVRQKKVSNIVPIMFLFLKLLSCQM